MRQFHITSSIAQYHQVVKPVASAIDILQRDDVFLGYLLPTLSVLRKRLEHLSMLELKYCAPLVDALQEGIHSR